MSEQTLHQTQALTVSDLAARKIKELMAERDLTDTALRVFVAGGGCSGMQYGMAFEPNPTATDTTIDAGDGVRLVIDPVSMPYIEGATVDFVESMMGGGFKIENPKAVSTCGCGHSFRADDAAAAEGDACSTGSCGCH